ncbi:hypothetical protein BCR36DRAFT_309443 [Piromyces finnis]|uniref:Alpha/beta-hydrolase n=1 Tax=Piromyces finnis TaxID=1754191 RepID=A0A1Y1UVC3_9FUNG|nr:hypothetical protein BCR36DRAFT_309443 [Piromyces finnis]|eukprot:ORX41911.1 hypothetical protein BCR36DRAFT_309443 [Piromyces finnis]
MVVQGYEWGPAVPRVIVEFNDKVSGFTKNTFKIKTGGVEREIINAYSSNKKGKQKENPSKHVTFDLKVSTVHIDFLGVNFGDASPLAYNNDSMKNEWATTFELELDLAENETFKIGNIEFGKKNDWTTYKKNLMENYIIPETDEWEKDTFTLNGKTLQRAAYAPEDALTDGVKNPLLIWLHGIGEGGNDIDIALLGNEVTALSRKDGIQKYFINEKQKGAYVLALQTPTMWMDAGDGSFNSEIDYKEGERQRSLYEVELFAAIKDYVDNNDDIDTSRIYVGGCSNGGYMTMDLMFEYGDYFAAFYPICEAYMNKNISDEMIEQVKDYNIWFLQAENDGTVDPLTTTIPSFYRLINAGAENVHFTLKENAVGSDDPSAVYFGHYAWVYAFNDDVKNEFDNSKVLEDFENITIEGGVLTSEDNYVTNANCSKDGNMWSWLASQSKAN